MSTIRKKKRSTMFTVVQETLIFVSLWGIVSTYLVFGVRYAAHGVLMIVAACVAAVLTHVVFYMVVDALERKTFDGFKSRITSNWKKVQRGTPIITGLILALAFQSATPLYVVAAAAIIAELIGKLMWGGFGKNKLNPAAVGFILAGIIFGYYVAMPAGPDAVSSATPLSIVARNGWYFTSEAAASFREYFGNLPNLLIGNFSGPKAETTRLASLISLGYLIYKKAVNWKIPAFYVGTVFIISSMVGWIHGFSWTYGLFHVLNGGLIFGAVFMATDPVTIPKSKPGQVVFAILLGMLTLVIRFRSQLYPEGVMIAILVLNMFAGYIQEKTATLAKAAAKVQWSVYAIIFGASALLVILLALGLPY